MYLPFGANGLLGMFDAASSNNTPKTLEENIARGRAAMRVVLKTEQDFKHAMHRDDLGWIDFIWGEVGIIRPNGKSKGGKGIAHIIEARMRKDDYSALKAHALVYRMVTTIAKGKTVSMTLKLNIKKMIIQYQGYEAVLVKDAVNNAWVLTGWELI